MCQLPYLGEKDPAPDGVAGRPTKGRHAGLATPEEERAAAGMAAFGRHQLLCSAAATGTLSRTSSSVSGKWHAARFPPVFESSSGSSTVHTSWHFQQRVWKRHACGGRVGLGTSPPRICRRLCRPGFGTGTAERSALVYGWRGCEYKASLSASSTILPRYMTATRSHM